MPLGGLRLLPSTGCQFQRKACGLCFHTELLSKCLHPRAGERHGLQERCGAGSERARQGLLYLPPGLIALLPSASTNFLFSVRGNSSCRGASETSLNRKRLDVSTVQARHSSHSNARSSSMVGDLCRVGTSTPLGLRGGRSASRMI